jgi:hypothetical protein
LTFDCQRNNQLHLQGCWSQCRYWRAVVAQQLEVLAGVDDIAAARAVDRIAQVLAGTRPVVGVGIAADIEPVARV